MLVYHTIYYYSYCYRTTIHTTTTTATTTPPTIYVEQIIYCVYSNISKYSAVSAKRLFRGIISCSEQRDPHSSNIHCDVTVRSIRYAISKNGNAYSSTCLALAAIVRSTVPIAVATRRPRVTALTHIAPTVVCNRLSMGKSIIKARK